MLSTKPISWLLGAIALSAAACGTILPGLTPTLETALPAPTSPLTPTSAWLTRVPDITSEPTMPTIAAVATSRGPDLEATEPEGVALNAGMLQLVEFFRFT